MPKKKLPVLPEEKESAHSLNLYITGEPIQVKIGNAFVYIRQPSYLERDQADFKENLYSRHIRVEDEEIAILSDEPAPKSEIERLKLVIKAREKLLENETDDIRKRIINERINFMYTVIEGRNAADAILELFSQRTKMRWLAKTLVIDEEGNRLEYNLMHPAVQDAIMEAVENMMDDIDTLPLELT